MIYKILLTFLLINTTSCISDLTYNNLESKEVFSRKGHYGLDIINLRVENKFTRENNTNPVNPKKYHGTYNQSNDTIHLIYEGNKIPNNEFKYYIIKKDTLIGELVYEKIKEKYSYLSRDELNKIENPTRIDTTNIKFIKK